MKIEYEQQEDAVRMTPENTVDAFELGRIVQALQKKGWPAFSFMTDSDNNLNWVQMHPKDIYVLLRGIAEEQRKPVAKGPK